MDFAENMSGFPSAGVLRFARQSGDRFFCVRTVNPALDRIDACVADAEFDGLAHRDAEGRNRSHPLEFIFLPVVLLCWRNPEKIVDALRIGNAIFFILRPALQIGSCAMKCNPAISSSLPFAE